MCACVFGGGSWSEARVRVRWGQKWAAGRAYPHGAVIAREAVVAHALPDVAEAVHATSTRAVARLGGSVLFARLAARTGLTRALAVDAEAAAAVRVCVVRAAGEVARQPVVHGGGNGHVIGASAIARFV